MNKYVKWLLPLLLSLTCLLTACEEYNPAVTKPGSGNRHDETINGNETQPPVTDASGNIDENPFTVTLIVEGKPYFPSLENPISVRWADGFSLHTAPVGADGVARVGGLDGDYAVTLTSVPAGYAYNPNIYRADNVNRSIEIELHKIVETTGKGVELYKGISIKHTGVYCVEIQDPNKEVYYEFAPSESGTYSVESWMDITADNVNPAANYYGANSAYRTFQYRADDGGVSGMYTKNFKLDVQIADENISKANTGSTVFTFGVTASSKTNEYPIKVYFAVTLDGEFSLNHTDAKLMGPTETLVQQPDYDPSKYEFVGAEFQKTVGDVTGWTFDADNYRLWPVSEGGDGYYHLYSTKDYPATHGYGPILYAKVSLPCRFMDNSFTTLEYAGNTALTVSQGTENYKLFIEGFDSLNSYTLDPVTNPNGIPPYFCTLNCPCRLNETCDSIALVGGIGACDEGCTECTPDCNPCPKALIGQKGYGNYTNADGCYAVTEELKQFMQKYSINQLLFFDGEGFVETHETIQIFAEEDDQWLFACGYYKLIA